ncbi:MAG: amidohydrolase family protein [Planctomycetota bacterium]|jgi:predicted TIM-barrel fold metal-dependent hydrolase
MPGRIIDFHTHAFPDALAEHAMARLGSETDEVHPNLDGKVSSLVASMDAEGIEMAVLCSIATKPSQFDPIFRWSQEIASDRIIPLASVHPKDPDAVKHIHQVAKAGLRGLKMHPYYQDFYLDDPQLYPLFEAIQSEGLLLTMHTGYDFAFDRIDRATPKQISDVIARFPEMKLITTHLGAWQQWDEVRRYLLGKPVYMETSFSIEYLGVDQVRRMLLEHSPDHILFGTDSPWTDQRKTFESHKKMDLPSGIESKYFYYNALRVLGMG